MCHSRTLAQAAIVSWGARLLPAWLEAGVPAFRPAGGPGCDGDRVGSDERLVEGGIGSRRLDRVRQEPPRDSLVTTFDTRAGEIRVHEGYSRLAAR